MYFSVIPSFPSAAPKATNNGRKCSVPPGGWHYVADGAASQLLNYWILSSAEWEVEAMTSVSQLSKSKFALCPLSFINLMLWNEAPDAKMSTLSFFNGDKASPILMCASASAFYRILISTIGILASGLISIIGTNTPWSQPLVLSMSNGIPLFFSKSPISCASFGSPGAGYLYSYVSAGKPP